MLTTTDLYTRPGYGIDVGYKVRFILLRGLELKTNRKLKTRSIEESKNPNSNYSVTGIITNYRPGKPGDLEIEGTMNEGYTFRLKLNQCRDLRRLF